MLRFYVKIHEWVSAQLLKPNVLLSNRNPIHDSILLDVASDSDSDSDKVYSTKIDTDSKPKQKTHHYTIIIYSWYIMILMHYGRPPLGSYLTAGMGATRRGRAWTSSEITHNATFWRRSASHGGHRLDHLLKDPTHLVNRYTAHQLTRWKLWWQILLPNALKCIGLGLVTCTRMRFELLVMY